MVVRMLWEHIARVRFSAPRMNKWAYSKVVLRVIRIDEAAVRFRLGPPFIHSLISIKCFKVV